MKIFLAGGGGAVGKRLIPLLRANGHDVLATTTSPTKMQALRELGATPVLMNGLDRESVMKVVGDAHPEAIVHQMTALASMSNLKHFDKEFALTNRLRTEGTEHLLAAAEKTGTKIFVAQSYAGWPSGQGGSRITTEDDPLDAHPVRSMSQTLDAIRKLEAMVTNAHGVVLRYGAFYGPGTGIAADGEVVKAIRKRMFPIVGGGEGVWSFLHIDDAARAVLLAIEHNPPGAFNIVDDEPVAVRVWLPELARALGAKPPRHVPAFIAKFLIGEAGVFMMTKMRGASNAKAKRSLGFAPVRRDFTAI